MTSEILLLALQASAGIAITNVTVIPMDRERTTPAQTVLIAGDRITRIDAAARVAIPRGARVIDGTGKYLIPGLADVHVHLSYNPPDQQRSILKMFLANGVTTVLNMRGAPQILELRAALASGEVLGPRLYSVGQYVNEPFVTTPDEVEGEVVAQRRAGYDFVKLHGNLSEEAYTRLNAVARRVGIRVIGHAPRNLGLEPMFRERQYALAHAEEFLYNRNNSSPDSSLPRVANSIDEWARRTAAARIWVMPNLTGFKMVARMVHDLDAVLARPEVRYLPLPVQQIWGPATNAYTNRIDPLRYEPMMRRYALLEQLVRAFRKEGVRLLVGTDAMNTGVVPGFSTHDEMADLVAAGLSPYEALRAATANAAEFLTTPGRHGTIAAREPADLVLLDANPLADIANTRRIAGVMLGGRWFARGDLDTMLVAIGSAPPRTYVVRGVHVIPMTDSTAPRLPDPADVVIRGRTIAQILPTGTATTGSGVTMIDGSGQYLIPGLIDSHVHIKEQDPLLLYVAAGVTTAQNMSGRPFHLDMRARVNAGTLLGPRIVTAGPTTAEAGVNTPAQAEQLVTEQSALGYDMIKMYGGQGGNFTPETYHALITAAHGRGMRVVGHAPRNLPFATVLSEGQNSVDHMEEIVYTHRPFARLLAPYVDLQFGRASAAVRDSLARVPVPNFSRELSSEITELARAVKQAGLAVTPNIVFFRNIYWMTMDSINALLRAPELAYAAPQQRLAWSPLLNRYANAWGDRRPTVSRYLGEVVELEKAITAAFHRAGVPLMAGTDAEFLGAQPGFGLHTELELFVGLGMSPSDALRAATVTPATVLRIADSVGTITTGKVADLVLLAANPLADIRNTRRISGVFRAGRWLPQTEIARSLDSLANSYRPLQTELTAFMQALEARGAPAAMEVYRRSPQRQQIAKPVENVINSYGYRVLGENRTKDAIAVFRLNTEAFPDQYNTWDSLAEAYLADGQRDLAIQYYRKVLELRPGDENATRMLRQLGVVVN